VHGATCSNCLSMAVHTWGKEQQTQMLASARQARSGLTAGARQAAMPKQYLPLRGQPIALYSLDVFAAMREVGEVVVVCDASYDGVFREHHARLPAGRPPLLFARPGAERQDSVCNGFAVRVACCGPRSPPGLRPVLAMALKDSRGRKWQQAPHV